MLRIADPQTPLGRETTVTVGVFDGIHLGHKGVLAELRLQAEKLGTLPAVVTFANHPDSLVGSGPPGLLLSPEHRLDLLEQEGVALAVTLTFTPELRDMSAEAFTRRHLVDRLGCRCLVMGWDSALGRNREGNLECMTGLGERLGFTVVSAPQLLWRGHPVSSSDIRRALEKGDLARTWALLGRPFSFVGVVQPGAGRGNRLGFATANLDPAGYAMPRRGVYAARARLEGVEHPAVVNLGFNPTFGGNRLLIEAHLLDHPGGELYGKRLEVVFHDFIRPERTFASPAALARQIGADIEACRKRLDLPPGIDSEVQDQ